MNRFKNQIEKLEIHRQKVEIDENLQKRIEQLENSNIENRKKYEN